MSSSSKYFVVFTALAFVASMSARTLPDDSLSGNGFPDDCTSSDPNDVSNVGDCKNSSFNGSTDFTDGNYTTVPSTEAPNSVTEKSTIRVSEIADWFPSTSAQVVSTASTVVSVTKNARAVTDMPISNMSTTSEPSTSSSTSATTTTRATLPVTSSTSMPVTTSKVDMAIFPVSLNTSSAAKAAAGNHSGPVAPNKTSSASMVAINLFSLVVLVSLSTFVF